MRTTTKMLSSSNYKDIQSDFERLNREFESYSKKLFRYGLIISTLLTLVLFVILFIRILYFELEAQSERIRLNSAIIDDKFNQVDDYLNLIKDSYIDFIKSESNKKKRNISSYQDKSGRYIHNSIYSGTYISLYKPLSSFQKEVQGLEYINHIIQGYKFDFLLWTYFYSKHKFVYIHPYLPDPMTYGFSEKSYEGNILKNTMEKDVFYISPVYHDSATERMVFSIAIPIYDHGKYEGTFAADIDLYDIFHEIQDLYKDTNGMSLFLVNKYNQYFSFDKIDHDFLSDYKKIGKNKFYFSSKDLRIVTSYHLMWDNYIVCSFPIKNIFYKSIINPTLIYFIFAIFMLSSLNFIMYFRFMKPLQNLIMGILKYLSTKSFFFNEDPKKIKRFGYKKDLINRVQSTFLFLVKQFAIKGKLDTDIRISQELLQYFIHNECHTNHYAYIIKPAFNFSGDYVRIFDLKKNPYKEDDVVSQIFFMADVSGKGIGAVLIVNQLNLFFDIYSDQIWDLGSFEEILNKFNRYFLEKNKNCDFIAFRALFIDREKNESWCIDAGLPQMYCIKKDQTVAKITLEDPYTPLGIDENEHYSFKKSDLFGLYSTVILCTDGILEQTNENGMAFEDPFFSYLGKNVFSSQSNQDRVQSIWEEFYSFIHSHENQQDDFTVLMIHL